MGNSINLLKEQFSRDGYVQIENFFSDVEVISLLTKAYECQRKKLTIDVNNKTLIAYQRFYTINGEDLEEQIPDLIDISIRVNKVVNDLAEEKYFPLLNKTIGVSLNIMPQSGQLSWHYDRNLITGVIHLNEVEGGLLEIYPRYRIRIHNNHYGIRKLFQRIFDALLRPAIVRFLLGRKVYIQPEAGNLIVIDSTCLHQVQSVTGDTSRVAIVLCYDEFNKDFREEYTQNYYGYKEHAAKLYR
jgi:hypothetical protein